MKKSRIIEEMYETAKDFHEGGLIDKRRMEEYDAMYKACQVPKYNGAQVKALRNKLNISQSVLAMIINASAATVRAWEIGNKNPSGPSCKLLQLLETRGMSALV